MVRIFVLLVGLQSLLERIAPGCQDALVYVDGALEEYKI